MRLYCCFMEESFHFLHSLLSNVPKSPPSSPLLFDSFGSKLTNVNAHLFFILLWLIEWREKKVLQLLLYLFLWNNPPPTPPQTLSLSLCILPIVFDHTGRNCSSPVLKSWDWGPSGLPFQLLITEELQLCSLEKSYFGNIITAYTITIQNYLCRISCTEKWNDFIFCL